MQPQKLKQIGFVILIISTLLLLGLAISQNQNRDVKNNNDNDNLNMSEVYLGQTWLNKTTLKVSFNVTNYGKTVKVDAMCKIEVWSSEGSFFRIQHQTLTLYQNQNKILDFVFYDCNQTTWYKVYAILAIVRCEK